MRTSTTSDAAPITGARCVLSGVEFDVVWESLGLGPTPVVLRLPSPGRTYTERRRIVAATSAGLREREVDGPTLRHLMRLLATAATRVEVRAWGAVTMRAVAAGDTDDGVLARRHGGHVVLEPCTSVPTAVVGLLPPAPPGPGRAANVPTAVLVAALERPSGAGLRADLVDRGVPPDEAWPAARMLHGVVGRTELGVVTTDRWGVPRRLPDGLGVVDTARGRYVVVRDRSDGDWTTVAPTDARRLRHRVNELLAAQSRSPWRMSCRPASVIEPDSDG